MITFTFAVFLMLSAAIALIDWRKGWYLALLAGVLQDPVRKLTPGTPVIMTLSIMVVYFALLFGAGPTLRDAAVEFGRKYPELRRLLRLFAFVLVVAALNGLATFGLGQWKVPALGLFTYAIPLTAVVVGFAFLRRESDLLRIFTFYAIVTSIALIAVPLEYLRVQSPILGTVALGEDWIRHLPGVQIRILSGTYRSPDIMAWHAAMLTMISAVMAIRRGFPRGWWWMAASGWGFLACLLSGRRKMLYMIAVFAAVLLWRYSRRLNLLQVLAAGSLALLVWFVLNRVAAGPEEARVYTKGTKTTRSEVLKRLEGGAVATFREYGVMGAGLGAATQGARHVAVRDQRFAWQEGGAGKLAVELGLPGLLMVAYAVVLLWRVIRRVLKQPHGSESLYLTRVALLAILAGNVASFLTSHQPYSDAVLILMTAFLGGAFFGSVRIEHPAESEPAWVRPRPQVRPMTAPAPLRSPLSARGDGGRDSV